MTYSALTASTTGENSAQFQRFHAEEIVQIINMLEEMPSGLRSTPGLQYLVRRRDGYPHPLYPGAPAVAWTDAGYIEFMDTAFLGGSAGPTHRLIIHEKAHFLWAHMFDAQLRDDWIELGGWFQTSDSPSGWWTTKQTEFVGAYAHNVNPNEDMAESIAYFVINPDKLRSRAIGEYEFIQDRIMQGNFYISTIREDLTFEVYNLFPDREVRVPPLASAKTVLRWYPRGNCILAQPDRDVAAAPEATLVLPPVPDGISASFTRSMASAPRLSARSASAESLWV